jgi:hypothetical protein
MRTILGKALLLLAFAGLAAGAQEAGSEVAEEKARAAQTEEPATQASADDQAAAREAIEPGVPSAVLAQDVRRRSVGHGVMDEIELGRTEITGNQELPKVMYIVPWQKSDPGDLTGKPVNTLLDEVLAPIDRAEFIRQVEYYDDLYREDQQ